MEVKTGQYGSFSENVHWMAWLQSSNGKRSRIAG